jgi:hypothetical protein
MVGKRVQQNSALLKMQTARNRLTNIHLKFVGRTEKNNMERGASDELTSWMRL